MEKEIAVIVLNYNSLEDTTKCVDQILSFDDEKINIIVVDNQSPDDSYTFLLKKYKDKKNVDVIITEANKGYSAGNNFGINYAKNKYNIEYVVIANPDIIVPNVGVFDSLMEAMLMEEDIVIAGAIIANNVNEISLKKSAWKVPSKKEAVFKHCLLNGGNTPHESYQVIANNVVEVDCVAGCFFMAKLDLFEKVGLLDENVFLYNEENILGLKCKRAGYKEVLDLKIYVNHNHHPIDKNMKFLKKVLSQKNNYNSRMYMYKNYLDGKFELALDIMELINRLYLGLCFLKNRMEMKNEKNKLK